MRKNTMVVLALTMALTGVLQAQAGDKERAFLGGLLGGWVLNEVADHATHDRGHSSSSVHIRTRIGARSPVVVERHPRHLPSGRYEYRRVRAWVPGYHERVTTSCGRVELRWVPGRYEIRTEKVWVSHEGSRSRERCGIGRPRH